jgi:ABC-type enterobactin transport system permease subunit
MTVVLSDALYAAFAFAIAGGACTVIAVLANRQRLSDHIHGIVIGLIVGSILAFVLSYGYNGFIKPQVLVGTL